MTSGFHDGEMAVQRRAGVQGLANRVSGLLASPHLGGGAGRWLAQRDLAVLTARDAEGGLWTAPLVGSPGFLDGDGTSLHVHTLPTWPPQPRAGEPIGMVAIDFATRRRVRVNGTLIAIDDAGFDVEVEQAYGNCPQFIQQRHLEHTAASTAIQWSDTVQDDHLAVISRADTFFLGTVHPT
jgi:hypothetical protein